MASLFSFVAQIMCTEQGIKVQMSSGLQGLSFGGEQVAEAVPGATSVGTPEKNEASEAVVVACVHLRLLLPDGGVWTSSGSRLDLGVLLLWGVTMRVDRRVRSIDSLNSP
jgi:hypothetical protein